MTSSEKWEARRVGGGVVLIESSGVQMAVTTCLETGRRISRLPDLERAEKALRRFCTELRDNTHPAHIGDATWSPGEIIAVIESALLPNSQEEDQT